MEKLPKYTHENGIDYVLVGDYYIPMLTLPEETAPDITASCFLLENYGHILLTWTNRHRNGWTELQSRCRPLRV